MGELPVQRPLPPGCPPLHSKIPQVREVLFYPTEGDAPVGERLWASQPPCPCRVCFSPQRTPWQVHSLLRSYLC